MKLYVCDEKTVLLLIAWKDSSLK